jgi:hypothetical protein
MLQGIHGIALARLGESGRRAAIVAVAAKGGGAAGKRRVGWIIGRYIYLPIDNQASLFFMNPEKMSLQASRQKEYARLKAQLGQIGWISQGYVQDRGPGAGGSCYPWTRKVKGKTIHVALSKEQYEWLKQAIANWRAVQETLRQMQRLSREELFESLPHPKRRKRLGKRVLGLV